MFAAPACLYPMQVLAVAAEAKTWGFFSSLRCVPLFPQRKRRGAKKAIYLLQTVTGLCNNTAFLSLF